jgi:hypothetical protein
LTALNEQVNDTHIPCKQPRLFLLKNWLRIATRPAAEAAGRRLEPSAAAVTAGH